MPRTVLVTGGVRGIGYAIASAFARDGDRLAVTHLPSETPPPDKPDWLWVPCEITDPDSVESMFSKVEADLGPAEVVVANAGITRDTLLLRMTDDDWNAVINVNLTGTFRVVRRAAKSMLRQKKGRIILIGSVVALLGSAGQVNYSSSKAALVGMARSLAREMGSRGITANVVAPGFVETAMTAQLSEETRNRYISQIPLGRYCQPEEIAGVVRWLGSDEAGYVSGAVIPVDGGLGMGH